MLSVLALYFFCILVGTHSMLIDFESSGAVSDSSLAGLKNTQLLNSILAELAPGDTLFISNQTFYLSGGVRATNVVNVTIYLDGTLQFLPGRKGWPTEECNKGGNPLQPKKNGTCVQECFFIANATGLTLTSSGRGTMYGNGQSWWGYVNYLIYGENRPRLLSIVNATDIRVEHWNFQQSPYWTFTAYDVARLEINDCSVENRVNSDDTHDVWNLAAFNTDGFDVAGRDIYIHDSSVWNQDDCFTIQPMDSTGTNAHCTENVLVENVSASGLGLTVGAIRPTRGHNCIRNVTFRHATMYHTFKGIYIKSENSFDPAASAELSDVLYENVYMESPSQVPIWIGPAQEADSAGACSLTWPELPGSACPAPPTTVKWANITLRNITVVSAQQSPGIVFGNSSSPMKNIVFDRVVFQPADPSKSPWGGEFYYCDGVQGVATNGTIPVPPCFTSIDS